MKTPIFHSGLGFQRRGIRGVELLYHLFLGSDIKSNPEHATRVKDFDNVKVEERYLEQIQGI